MRKVTPLRASQSLSETFPCTGYKTFYLKGKALRGNRCAQWNSSALSAPRGSPRGDSRSRRARLQSGTSLPSVPAELGGEIHHVSRNRACTKVLLQARKLHVCGSGTFGASWQGARGLTSHRIRSRQHPLRRAARALPLSKRQLNEIEQNNS